MTTRTDPELEPLDLSSRARLGPLPPAEQQVFERALEESATLRVAHEIGRSFDLIARVRPGDEAFVERAADRALANRALRSRRRVSRLAVLLAAALVMASAVAATRAALTPDAPNAPSKKPVVRPPVESPPRSAPPDRAESTSTPEPARPPAQNPVLVPESAARSAEAGPQAPDAPPGEKNAASLFRRAGSARRAGDFENARALYVELQTRFPDSNEARVSHVSLGKLLLGAGWAREAELEFARYLRSGAFDLREEALVGRADALSRLGRGSEERNVWQELLRRHPASVYGVRARERIAELERLRPEKLPK
jgi:TolA-binding protein